MILGLSTLKKGALAVFSVGALVLGSGVANASPSDDGTREDQVVSTAAPTSFDNQYVPRSRSTDAGEADPRVIDYWTQERIDNAIPADTFTSGNDYATREALPPTDTASPQRVLSDPVSGAVGKTKERSTRSVSNFSEVNGKVLFTNAKDGLNYICSGSALNSHSKRLVITAGHCVHGGGKNGAWHKNWVFIPDYHYNHRPYGTFQAKTFTTFQGWIDNGEGRLGFERDVAFVTTYTNASGQKVVDAVGGYGLRTGGSKNFDVTVFGYPGNLDGGERMWACWGRTTTHRWWLSSFPKITGCNFGGGSSGGPWLDDYSNSTGLGHVRSVTSFGPKDNSYNGGPYFDDAVMNLFNSTRND